jgi:hypothetical protein
MPVRVVRILEYVYATHADAEQDMRRWSVSPYGSFSPNKRMTVSSAVMPPRTFMEDEETDIDGAAVTIYCMHKIRDTMCGAELTPEGVCPQMHMHDDHPGGH